MSKTMENVEQLCRAPGWKLLTDPITRSQVVFTHAGIVEQKISPKEHTHKHTYCALIIVFWNTQASPVLFFSNLLLPLHVCFFPCFIPPSSPPLSCSLLHSFTSPPHQRVLSAPRSPSLPLHLWQHFFHYTTSVEWNRTQSHLCMDSERQYSLLKNGVMFVFEYKLWLVMESESFFHLNLQLWCNKSTQ